MRRFKRFALLAVVFMSGGFAGAATVNSEPAMLTLLIVGLVILAIVAYKTAPGSPEAQRQQAIQADERGQELAQGRLLWNIPQRYTVVADGGLMLATHDLDQANKEYDGLLKLSPRSRLMLSQGGRVLRQNF